MANVFENYGLGLIGGDESAFTEFVKYCTAIGKPIPGYYGTPYLFQPLGHVELWLRTDYDEDGNLAIDGVDLHSCGNCIWDVFPTGIDISSPDEAKLSRTLMVQHKDGRGGMLPVHIVNSDVLPSLMSDDEMRLQVIAQPLHIGYYADEDEYMAAQSEVDRYGKRWAIGDGALLSTQFLYNHSPERYEQGRYYETDRYVMFRATVTKLYHGTFDMEGVKKNLFIRCFAQTEYGELEFDHTIDQVPEELRKNIKVGAVIGGVCVISGDAAIGEFENGPVRDSDHDLRLLRYSFEKGRAERLRSVLDVNAEYYSETTGKTLTGPDEIIERLDYVHENADAEYFADLATITDAEELEYPAGTRCIVLSYGERGKYESIAFVTVNYEGLITRIHVSTESRYRFRIFVPDRVRNSVFDDIDLPERVSESIITRAKFHSIIPADMDEDELLNGITNPGYLEENAMRMLEALKDVAPENMETAFENIFGYLFAKSMEQEMNRERHEGDQEEGNVTMYCPSEAVKGEITSTLPVEMHTRLELAMDLGRQFYKDLKFFVENKHVGEDAFAGVYREAAVIVQYLGRLGSKAFLER